MKLDIEKMVELTSLDDNDLNMHFPQFQDYTPQQIKNVKGGWPPGSPRCRLSSKEPRKNNLSNYFLGRMV